MVNAVEHGNLGIDYDQKTALLADNKWEEEIERRLSLPENKDVWAKAYFKIEDDNISVRIVDEGDGFEWRRFLNFDAERATDYHGRGIAMSKLLSFDEVIYEGEGNSVLATVKI